MAKQKSGNLRRTTIGVLFFVGLIMAAVNAANRSAAPSANTAQAKPLGPPSPPAATASPPAATAAPEACGPGEEPFEHIDPVTGDSKLGCRPTEAAAAKAVAPPPPPARPALSGEAARKEAQAVLVALRDLEREGRGMESMRRSGALERCGDIMRRRQAEAAALESRADALPGPVRSLLSGPARSMKLCVSCARMALDHCEIAREAIDYASGHVRRMR